MLRIAPLLLLVLSLGVLGAAARAQDPPAAAPEAAAPVPEGAPEAEAPAGEAAQESAPANFVRGPGFYLSSGKIFACWIVFLLWVYHTDWVSTDCQSLKLDYLRWNPIVFGCFMAAFILVWLLPFFWIGFPLLVIAYLAPLITYIVYRNSKVTNEKRVMTLEHIRYWLADKLAPVGINIPVEKKKSYESGAPVILKARADTEQENNVRTISARQIEGFNDARQLLSDALLRRASAIMLDYGQQSVGVRYLIDGVWHNAEALDRETADPLLAALKTLCGLNPQERQAKQSGPFLAEYEMTKYDCALTSQGVKTGERVAIQLVDEVIRFEDHEALGMRPKMVEEVRELLDRKKGFLLLSAPPANGLRSTTHVLLQKTDRYTREFVGLEEEKHRYQFVENIPISIYSTAKEETPLNALPRMFRTAPDVVVVRDLVDADTVDLLCDEIDEGRLIISTIRSKSAIEAIQQVLALEASRKKFARHLTAVLNQRLVRKLCDECKEAYAPTPQVLEQLKIPAGRVQAFYRPPQQPEEVCEACGGIGYKGRTAVFELLVVDDAFRQALTAGAAPEQLLRVAQKAGFRNLQAEGIILVAKGVTSLPELMRVLKQ